MTHDGLDVGHDDWYELDVRAEKDVDRPSDDRLYLVHPSSGFPHATRLLVKAPRHTAQTHKICKYQTHKTFEDRKQIHALPSFFGNRRWRLLRVKPLRHAGLKLNPTDERQLASVQNRKTNQSALKRELAASVASCAASRSDQTSWEGL